MGLKRWEDLPPEMRTKEVYPYYQVLTKKKSSIWLKKIFDLFTSSFLLIILSPILMMLSIAIKVDSKGPIFYRQERITRYGKKFLIYKFRTMVVDADKKGTLVTVKQDPRITGVGRFLRKYRLDELPQLINIFLGEMSFVGTRPEVSKYVSNYTDEMYATLLLPAGVTSVASIEYKDEEQLLSKTNETDHVYITQILPQKMKINLEQLKDFGFMKEIGIMVRTVWAVLK